MIGGNYSADQVAQYLGKICNDSPDTSYDGFFEFFYSFLAVSIKSWDLPINADTP